MPYTIPKKRKVIRTIKINNGTLTAEADENEIVYWFRNGEYITPYQMKNYKYYDPSIKGYRTLADRITTDFDKMEKTVSTPVFTPNLDRLRDDNRDKHRILHEQEADQRIPYENQEWVTLRTKGKMNLADFPINGLDSIAINAGRSNTDFWTDAALLGKESTFGRYAKYLGHGAPEIGNLYPHFLTNNHAYFNTAEDDYIQASLKKYNHYDDAQLVKAENDAKYAIENGLVEDKVPHYSKYVLADAFKRYEVAPTQYNPGQKNYVPMLNGIRQELMGDKQLQEYWNTRGREYYSKGQQEGMAYGGSLKGRSWDELSMTERAAVMQLAVQNGMTNLDDIRGTFNEFSTGGSIHIKPENRGKFTALKKRTGHSASWFKAHGTPAQKKMAVFALNARKWKH